MSFLQPFILWGLPLALLPVLIHLLNRLRHRSIPWAAMMFLRTATRKSTRYARLRQFLILLFRVLAVAGLVMALSRPLAGGWAGWMLSSTPDTILVLLDRSTSMEARQGELSRREEAVRLLAQSARKLADTSRLVLFDSATRAPQEIPNAAALPEVSLAKATDTAANLPALVQSALDWLQATKPGFSELWIASDLQSSNWQPLSDRWPALAAGLRSLPQGIRVRMLALNAESQPNVSVAVVEATRRQTGQDSELELTLDFQRNTTGPVILPLTLNLDGAPSQIEVKMDGLALRYRHKISLPASVTGGWGFVELPADGNLRDNRSYFVYGRPPTLRAAVVSSDSACGRILQLASAPDSRNTNQISELIPTNSVATMTWDKYALVLWQGPLPEQETARHLSDFVEAGGVVVFFPGGEPGQWDGSGWGPVQSAPAEKTFPVSRWDEREGPLAKTAEGWSLPVSELGIQKRQAIAGEKIWLATFDDGTPFLTRRSLGRGQVFFCATLPKKDWSQLYDGAVIVPMMQRLLETGGHRFSMAASASCGDWQPGPNDTWTAVDNASAKDIRTQAGVYRSAGRLLAVNRPPREDNNDLLEPAQAKALFGSVPVHLFEEKEGISGALQSELWRLFLFSMLFFLLAEAVLILPEKTTGKEEPLLIPPLPVEAERPKELELQ